MRKNQSAGILLYRFVNKQLEVLLVHPGGPYHIHKDIVAWSIPKGLFEEGESALAAAKREFQEEIGQELKTDKFIQLSPIKQKAGKEVHAWAAEGDLDVSTVQSNVFRMEYPYKSGKWINVPEVDRAEWFDLETARQKINTAQVALINELDNILKK